MTESRLNGLALLYTHKEMKLNLESIFQHFDATGHRKIGSTLGPNFT